MLNTKQVIETLKKEVQTNKALDATLHICAMRKRARNQLTLNTLYNRMHQEHYKFTRGELAGVLKLFADTGVGRLEVDRKGRPKALKDIKVTLQSLGNSALTSASPKLDTFKPKSKYKIIASEPNKSFTVKPNPGIVGVSIQAEINGKIVLIPVPSNLTPEDVADLVRRFQNNTT